MRHLLRLPANATTGLLHAPTTDGSLGLVPLVERYKALQVAHAFAMLHSPDSDIRAVARAQVRQIAQRRFVLDEEHWRGGELDDELVVATRDSQAP